MQTSAMRVVAAVLAAVVMATTACDTGEDGAADPDPPTTEEPRSAPDETEPAQSDGGEDAGDDEEPAQAGELTDLDIQQRHPNGTVLRVLGISLGPTSIAVEVEALNGFTQEITLNGPGVHLVDDLGNSYNFVEPEQNAQMNVAPGAVLSGTLTFIGRVDKDATSLRLLINTYEPEETVDVADEYERSTSPAFQIDDIPIPGR